MTKFIEMEVTPSLQKYMDKLKEGGKVELQVWCCHVNHKASHSSAFYVVHRDKTDIGAKIFFLCVEMCVPYVFHVTISYRAMNSCFLYGRMYHILSNNDSTDISWVLIFDEMKHVLFILEIGMTLVRGLGGLDLIIQSSWNY